MKFSYYFKENILGYNLKSKELFKIVALKRLNETSYKLNTINSKRKNEFIVLEKNDVRKFKFYKTKRIGKKTIQFEEVVSLLNENDTGTAFGDTSAAGQNAQFSSDWYAPNDARSIYGGMPMKVQRRNLKNMENVVINKKKKKKSKKKKDGKKK